jgi:hypothetical protein
MLTLLGRPSRNLAPARGPSNPDVLVELGGAPSCPMTCTDNVGSDVGVLTGIGRPVDELTVGGAGIETPSLPARMLVSCRQCASQTVWVVLSSCSAGVTWTYSAFNVSRWACRRRRRSSDTLACWSATRSLCSWLMSAVESKVRTP